MITIYDCATQDRPENENLSWRVVLCMDHPVRVEFQLDHTHANVEGLELTDISHALADATPLVEFLRSPEGQEALETIRDNCQLVNGRFDLSTEGLETYRRLVVKLDTYCRRCGYFWEACDWILDPNEIENEEQLLCAVEDAKKNNIYLTWDDALSHWKKETGR